MVRITIGCHDFLLRNLRVPAQVHRHEEPYWQCFSPRDVVVLSPDATEVSGEFCLRAQCDVIKVISTFVGSGEEDL